MFSENIWTRIRKLQDEKGEIHLDMIHAPKKVDLLYQVGNWERLRDLGANIQHWAKRLEEIEAELELVEPLADGFDRICKRMEELEAAARAQGWEG